MLEALMVVTMMSGQEITTKLPDFNECLKNVQVVEQQPAVKSVACIPNGPQMSGQEKFWTFFDAFQTMIDKQNDYCERNPFNCQPDGVKIDGNQ